MPKDRRPLRYRSRAVLSGLLFAAPFLGCSPALTDDAMVDQLNGRFVANDGVYVVADRAWRREGADGGSFRKTASFIVVVKSDAPAGLRFSLTPDPATAEMHFLARWNGHPLWEEARRPGDNGFVVEIDADRLDPGRHHLSLDRVKGPDEPADRARGRNVFTTVEATRLDAEGERPQRILDNGYLARFLDFGVTSRAPTRLSGNLFLGSQRLAVPLRGDESELRFTLDNATGDPARFSATIDGRSVLETEVAPLDHRAVRFEVPSGGREMVLETEGRPGGCLLWGAPHAYRAEETSRPPVLLITLDTTRRDAVAPYSSRPELTPNIAAFAGRATVYTNAYATAPWTLPSHASMFTGMYPSHHRAGVVDDVLAESWFTLAERFRAGGYRTAGFIGGHMTSSSFGVAQGFSVFRDPRGDQEPGNVLTDAAVELLETDGDLPLFLFVNYFDPHAPYSAPAFFRQRLEVPELARTVADHPEWGPYARGEPGSWSAVVNSDAADDDDGLAYLRARYDAEVAFMDAEIGRLFAALDDRGLFDDALVVLVSDHGEFMGEQGLFSHSYRLDRELTAVPLLIKWPGQRDGEVVDALVSHVDLYPAIAAAAGLDVPSSDGIGFGRGDVGRLSARERVFMEEHKSRFHQLPGPFWIADHLFGLQWLDRREVLYDGVIECEQRLGDAWVSADCARSWREGLALLSDAMRATLELDVEVSEADLDEAEAERLRALGYL